MALTSGKKKKVKKVIKGLNKASKLHAGQAKSLKNVLGNGKKKRVSKPFARKIQILTVGEQRAKVMGKSKVASIFKRGKEAIRKAHGRKKKTT